MTLACCSELAAVALGLGKRVHNSCYQTQQGSLQLLLSTRLVLHRVVDSYRVIHMIEIPARAVGHQISCRSCCSSGSPCRRRINLMQGVQQTTLLSDVDE